MAQNECFLRLRNKYIQKNETIYLEIELVAIIGYQIVTGFKIVHYRFPRQISVIGRRNDATLNLVHMDRIFNAAALIESAHEIIATVAELGANEHVGVLGIASDLCVIFLLIAELCVGGKRNYVK